MARKRMIDPSIWTDEGMAALEARQQLLFIGLFSNADDEGRLKSGSLSVRLMLPTVYGSLRDEEVRADLDAVIGAMRHLCAYEVEGRSYLAFTDWARWQRVDRPTASALPPPPGEPSHHLNTEFDEQSSKDPRGLDLKRRESSLGEEKIEEVREGAKRATRTRQAITAEETEQLVVEFSGKLGDAGYVRERIKASLNHKAVDKVKSEYDYVHNWLTGDVRYQQERSNGTNRNGASDRARGAGAPGVRGSRGATASTRRPGERELTPERAAAYENAGIKYDPGAI